MKKRIFSLLLALTMLCSLLPRFTLPARAEDPYSGTCGENLTWRFDPDSGKLTIEGSGAMTDFIRYKSSTSAPWSKYCGAITSVSLPEGLTSIGDCAFGLCSALTSLTIPNSVTSIGEDAFELCSALTAIQVASNNPSYSSQDGVLFGKAETELIRYPAGKADVSYAIPNSVTYIGDGAFAVCSSLTSVTIPEGVNGIGDAAFFGCSALTSVTIPESVISIGERAFSGCSSLTSVTIPTSGTCGENLTWRFDLVSGKLTIEGSGAMTDFIRYISSTSAPWFKYCRAITSVSLPEGLTHIGDNAFDFCSSLTSLTIPNSVTSIGDGVFSNCSALTAIQVASNNPSYSSQDGVLFDKAKTELIKYPAGKADVSYAIPNSVTSIGDRAFVGCSSLTSVTIPNSVTSIEEYAFAGCSALTSVTIPESVTSIGKAAFSGCSSLTSVTILNGVTSIGEWAFSDCSALTSVTIPESVTSIGEWAFSHCNSLTSVTIPASVSEIGELAFGWGCNEETFIFERVINFTIYGYNRSEAQRYAEEDGFKFVSLDNSCANDHDWDAGKLILKPEAEHSERVFTCARCGETKTEKLSNKPFADVSGSKFYNVPVLWAYYHSPQITSGTSATQFSPNQPCSRGQVVSFLWRANGEQQPKSSKNPFADAKAGKYYYNAMLWAVEKGVTSGVDATHFQPNGDCSRAQVVTFLWRAAGSPEPKSDKNPFVDVKAGKFYYKAVLWAVENGVTAGTDATHFSPNAGCTRGQVVTFLYRQQAQ